MTRKKKTPWGAYPHLPNSDSRWNNASEPTDEERAFAAFTKALERPHTASTPKPVLPRTDKRGIEQVGHGYAPYHKASRSKVGNAGNMYLHKAQGMTPFHSHVEEKILLHFNHLPRVRALRAQYAVWDPDTLRRYDDAGKRLPKSFVKTFDVVLTVDMEGNGELTEVIIDVKHSEKLSAPETIRRQERDLQDAERLSWDYKRFTDKAVSRMAHYNNTRIAMYMCHVAVEDLEKLAPDAARFAQALKVTKAKGTMERVITMIAKRFGWDVNQGLQYFAIAHHCGYLRWDHKHKLEYNRPLMLVKDHESVDGRSKGHI